MQRSRSAWLILGLVACGTDAAPGGDDSHDPGGTCPLYEVPATTDMTQPIVSFKGQVMPIFNATCNNQLCHGNATEPSGGLFLGSTDQHGLDAPQIRARLVDLPSQVLPSMPFVTPGDPANSFLMHKVDADQCAFDGDCGELGCGARMPRGGTMPLPVANRDQIRRWIVQGAGDN